MPVIDVLSKSKVKLKLFLDTKICLNVVVVNHLMKKEKTNLVRRHLKLNFGIYKNFIMGLSALVNCKTVFCVEKIELIRGFVFKRLLEFVT